MTVYTSRMLLLLLATASLLVARQVQADDAADRTEQYLAELRFDEASKLATTTLAKGNNEPSEIARLYMVLGQIQASMGKDSDAVAMFLNALSIDAEIRLPDGVSPKIDEPFTKAKARLEGASPISLAFKGLTGDQLRVVVQSDPANLIGGVKLSYQLKGKKKTALGRGRNAIEITVPEGASALRVRALDMQGNHLTDWQAMESAAAAAAATTALTTVPATPSKQGVAIYQRWEIYAGLSGAALACGLYFGKSAEDYASDISGLPDGTEFSVAQDLEAKADSQALYANISFVGAGLLGAAAFWMYSREPSAKQESTASATAIVPVVSPDSLGVRASLRF